MTIEHRIDGVLLTNRVELVEGIDGGLPTAAERGAVAAGGVIIDDPLGALNLATWRPYTVDDTDATPTRVYTGRALDRTIGRNGKQFTGSATTWNCTVEDLNNELHRVLIRNIDNDGKRPAETDVARLTWLLGSRAMSGIVYDEGLVSSAGAIGLLAQDERQKFADDIISEWIAVAGKNFYTYHDTATGHAAFAYDHDENAYWAAGISISNAGDDNGTTIFAPEPAVATHRGDPSEGPYTGVQYVYKGIPIFAESATTITALGGLRRELVYDTDRVGHLATAQAEAVRWLNQHAGETNLIPVDIVVPSAAVNKAFAGQEISVKLINIPGMESGVTCRIRRRDPRPVAPGFWNLHLELWAPRTAASDAAVQGDGVPTTTSGILYKHGTDNPTYDWKRGKSSVAWRIPWRNNGDCPGAGAPSPLVGLIEYQSWNGMFPAGSPGATPGGPYTDGAPDNSNMGSGFRCLGGGALDVSFTYDLNELPAGTATIQIRKNGTTVVATGSYAGPVLDATGTVSATGVAVVYGDVLACYAFTPDGAGFSLGNTYGSSFSVTGTLTAAAVAPLPATGAPIDHETPAAQPDGATSSFAANFPYLAGTLHPYLDGQRLLEADFTETNPITGAYDLAFVPEADEVLELDYTAA